MPRKKSVKQLVKPEPTETATDGKTDIHVFRYNGAIWQEVGRTMNLSES